MKIGTDVSIQECRKSGYLIMDFKVRGLFPNGHRAGPDPDYPCRFYCYIPGKPLMRPYMDTLLSLNCLKEMFEQHSDSILSMCGIERSDLRALGESVEDITEHDLLTLADSINSYCGLE